MVLTGQKNDSLKVTCRFELVAFRIEEIYDQIRLFDREANDLLLELDLTLFDNDLNWIEEVFVKSNR